MNELLDYFHAGIELIQGENVLLGEEPQPWALPEVLQGQQRQSYGGLASRSWGRQTALTCTHTSNDPHPPPRSVGVLLQAARSYPMALPGRQRSSTGL